MMDYIKKITNVFTFAFFTVKCPYCNQVINKNEYACSKCKSKFPENPLISYAKGGYKCVSSFPYDGIFRKAVHNFKFYNCGAFAEQFSAVVAMDIKKDFYNEEFDLITCVPIHKKALKKRRYNQAELLAKHCAKRLNIPYIDTLEKFKENKAQHSIKAKYREKNVKGVYRIIDKSLVKGKKILIIDDIITTGNTLGECAKTIEKSGSKKICCATICAVQNEAYNFSEAINILLQS